MRRRTRQRGSQRARSVSPPPPLFRAACRRLSRPRSTNRKTRVRASSLGGLRSNWKATARAAAAALLPRCRPAPSEHKGARRRSAAPGLHFGPNALETGDGQDHSPRGHSRR